MQADIDFGVTLAQLGDGPRQHIAGLVVGGGNGQRASILLRELVADALEVVDLAHDDLDGFEHLFARLGDSAQAFAVPGKNVHTQFALELQDGFGNARL